MTYKHDDQAREEAAAHSLPEDRIPELDGLVSAKRDALGAGGVRAHRVGYNRENWDGLLPPGLAERDSVSRGEVFAIAETGSLTDVFTASYVWGVGRIGYGPTRYRNIVDSTGGRLEVLLNQAVEAGSVDVIAGYSMFYGGDDAEHRSPANHESVSRIKGFGPAFFTKFLYFTHPDALILDNVLAGKVATLSGLPHLVDRRGRSKTWSPYRYAVYLHWMCQTAATLKCSPEELEFALFTAPDFSELQAPQSSPSVANSNH